ncbi:MAG: hypothetical protein IIZ54_11180 [Selenomonadaceae bacterium]|nr:hypothetical protein [Selenomonadaceae bacterium]
MHKKEEFYGVWGRMRADFLREKKPAVYRRLEASGDLMSATNRLFPSGQTFWMPSYPRSAT